MKVRDIMSPRMITVQENESIRDVAGKIVSNHISGVFVVDDHGDVIGSISHADILRRIFPSQEEFYDDLVHSIDFEQIQLRAHEVVGLHASDVMEVDLMRVPPDVHIMKVAAWMLLRDVKLIAVIGSDGKLEGVVSRGDIFYHTMAAEVAAKQPAKAPIQEGRSANGHSALGSTA